MLVENDIEQIDQLLNRLHPVFHHHLIISKNDYSIEKIIYIYTYQVLVELQKELYLFSYHEFENE